MFRALGTMDDHKNTPGSKGSMCASWGFVVMARSSHLLGPAGRGQELHTHLSNCTKNAARLKGRNGCQLDKGAIFIHF